MNGSIRRRGKGTYELTIDLGKGSNGRRQRKFVSVKGTKAEADQKLMEVLTRLDKGMSLDGSKSTVGEFLESWLSSYVETNTGPRTLDGYREKIRGYILPSLGNLVLVKMTPQHVQSLYGDMLARGLSARTVLHTHRILS